MTLYLLSIITVCKYNAPVEWAFTMNPKNKKLYPVNKISVANGGDRKESNAPPKELSVNNVNYVWGIGGSKTDSSSSILKKYVESYNDTL